tara:strand:- start:4443 stop:4967 length:525 start_codon:yes stop_codon:yes gene_type:complete
MITLQQFLGYNSPELEARKKLYEEGKATRVITGYRTQRIGPDGSKKVPVYDYVPNQPAAPAPAPPPPPPAPAPSPPVTLTPEISQASKDYRAETQALADQTAQQIADFNASQDAADKSKAIAAANQSRSGTTAKLQIQPASQTEKRGGTSSFKRRKKNQPVAKLMSGISGMVNI